MIRLLLTALLNFQEADLSRRVEELGDPSPLVRERATDLLESKGRHVLPDLQTAARGADLEIRSRAREILFHLEPSLFLEELKDAQRPRRTAFGRRPDVESLEGGWFRFERRLWAEKGIVTGTVLTTTAEPQEGVFLNWTIDAVLAGCEIPVERCAVHSPHLLFVPAETTDPCQVRIKGTWGWTCKVPVTFRNPAMGDARRIGPYTITLEWPELILTADQGMPVDGTSPFYFGNSIDCRLKPGRAEPASSIAAQDEGDEPAIFFPERPIVPLSRGTWCGCPGPRKDANKATDPARWSRVRIQPGRWKNHRLEDLASISLIFPLPVTEPFELISPPLE